MQCFIILGSSGVLEYSFTLKVGIFGHERVFHEVVVNEFEFVNGHLGYSKGKQRVAGKFQLCIRVYLLRCQVLQR